jgi:hypothetical protein
MTRTIKALALGGALLFGGALFVPAIGAQDIANSCGSPSVNLEATNVSFNQDTAGIGFNAEIGGVSETLELGGIDAGIESSNVSFNQALGAVTAANTLTCR